MIIRKIGGRGGNSSVLSVTYIEFAVTGTLSDDAIGIRSGALPADGQQLASDANGIQWIGSSGVIQSNAVNFAGPGDTAKTWSTSDRPGIAFGTIPAGNAELLAMLNSNPGTSVKFLVGDAYAFFFKDGVYQNVAIRLATYLSSPVRPAAHISASGSSVNITLKAAAVDWTGSPILLTDVSAFPAGVVWVDENSVVLSGSDLTAAYGAVANWTPVRTNANAEFAF